MISNTTNQPKFSLGQQIMTPRGKATITNVLELPEIPDDKLMDYLGAETMVDYNEFVNDVGNAIYTVKYDLANAVFIVNYAVAYEIEVFNPQKFEIFTRNIGIEPIKKIPFLLKYKNNSEIYRIYHEMYDTFHDIEIKESCELLEIDGLERLKEECARKQRWNSGDNCRMISYKIRYIEIKQSRDVDEKKILN